MHKFFLILFFACYAIAATEQELFKAVKEDNVVKARQALKKEDVNCIDEKGLSPLYYASSKAMIHELVIANADLEIGPKNLTPLIHAIQQEKYEKAILLVLSGASVNIMYNGVTPLHMAIEKNNYELVFYLVKMGARVNPANIEQAKKLNRTNIVLLLEEYKKLRAQQGSLYAFDKDGLTPLHKEIMQNNAVVVDSISLVNANLNAQDRNGNTLLCYAKQQGLDAITEKLSGMHAK